ncbi:RNA-directed DNA polymerase, eukaryota [Tanacetum coccineum]|uniref:RNA-directed DNA polymerase, eukaryota n=1 Tax=Tanacetum coccineum TaxID=301880 RepID=A0ABQ5FRP0_9ASTR
MGSRRSKEDDVNRISISIYVTNFPEFFFAKELFQSCKQYGHVVDSFIPRKRTKEGKRFGFVRFINVFNVDRLVNNLCTIWVGQFKLHANKARFQRATLNKGQGADHKKVANSPRPNSGDSGSSNSYVNAVKNHKSVDHDSPAIVLDEDCALSKDLSSSLMGRIKEFASLTNLKNALMNEGFVDLNKSVNDFEEEKLNEDDGDSNNSNLKENVDESASFGRFKKSVAPSLAQKAKKDWAKELCVKNKVNFLAIQETKMEEIDLFSVRRGVWLLNGIDLMIIAVYAPHDPRDKRMLWDYLAHVINQWQGEVVIMGDFNEVRVKSDRFGTNFNVLGANIFNSFINSTGLEEVHLGGVSFFPKTISEDQSQDLEGEVSKQEIKTAVWGCGTDKSPGPDGNPPGCNSSFIALIPKVPDANLVKDFRPISLIGSIYKIIAKILSNRLVNVLGDIVNEVQSAFIAERQMLDGPFSYDMLPWLPKRRRKL